MASETSINSSPRSMIHLPTEIISILVDSILLADQYKAPDFIRTLCRLRLTSRLFADTPVIKAILFKATHASIGPYVHDVILEPSQFDSMLSKERYTKAVLNNRYYTQIPHQADFSNAFRKYHDRAVEDEAVETELQEIWSQAFVSFHHLRRLALGHSAINRGGRDADRSDLLSFHRLNVAQTIPIVNSAQRNTGYRLLRLVAPLLCTPGLPVKSLSVKIQGDRQCMSNISTFGLNPLQHLYLGVGSSDGCRQSSEALTEAKSTTALEEMTHRIDLLAKLLSATQSSIQELTLAHINPGYSFRWSGQVFPAEICSTRLRVLYLSAFDITVTHLISALEYNFPNLKQLIFSNDAKPILEDSSNDGWPMFFQLLKNIPQRGLKVEGEIMLRLDEDIGRPDNVPFSIRLGANYTRQYREFEARTCSRRTALSVSIRRFMDDLITWDRVLDDYPDIIHWFGKDGDDEGDNDDTNDNGST